MKKSKKNNQSISVNCVTVLRLNLLNLRRSTITYCSPAEENGLEKRKLQSLCKRHNSSRGRSCCIQQPCWCWQSEPCRWCWLCLGAGDVHVLRKMLPGTNSKQKRAWRSTPILCDRVAWNSQKYCLKVSEAIKHNLCKWIPLPCW